MTSGLFAKISGRLRTARAMGIGRALRIALDRTALAALRSVYGFNAWHVEAPLSARPYRQVVAELANSVDPQCAVEVGCGLGSILGLISAPERYGYDVDAGAVRAARFLRGRNVHFLIGGMEEVTLPHIDVLILVNWIHAVSPDQLERWLLRLLPRTRHLVLDAIDPDGPEGYQFKHDFAFLDGIARPLKKRRVANEGRTFVLYQINSPG